MRILTTLSDLEILTRSQLQSLFNLGGIRNANYVMKSLREYTRFIFVGENAYYLNKRGMAITGARKHFRYNSQVTHKIMRNDAYIYFKPTDWITEQEIDVRGIKVVPDAFFFSGSSHKFLEIDNEQRWINNVKKFEEYSELKKTGAFQRKYGRFPSLIWIVKYESRIARLKELAKKYDLFCEIYSHKEVRI